MITDQYVWFTWSVAFLIPWFLLYGFFPRHRQAMLWASAFTAPFGLTEPLFVPEYWSPPSLFDLAARTGFDLESLVFCFGIGGVAAVLANVVTGKRTTPIGEMERHRKRHRLHRWVLVFPFVTFIALLPLGWNPIYPGIIAMLTGAALAVICRPDLALNTVFGGGLFLTYYGILLLGLEWLAPGYVDRVWNLPALSGIRLGFMPLEELLFAFAFGSYWAGVYEHFNWRGLETVHVDG